MSDKGKSDFGLGDLSDFAPEPVASKPARARGSGKSSPTSSAPQRRATRETVTEIQALAEKDGFSRREPEPEPINVRRTGVGTTVALYLRLKTSDFNRLVKGAGHEGLGRADFLAYLLDLYEEQGRR